MRRRDLCTLLALAPIAAHATAAAPTGVSPRIGPAFFGMHFHSLAATPEAARPTPWPEPAPFGALRLWDADTRWADLAPAPGSWDFDRLDTCVALAAAHRVPVLYTLGSPPRWASARHDEAGPYGPGSAAEPARLGDWIAYVRRVASRYRGRIQAYELWNEPNFADIARDRGAPGFYTGDVGTMVALARATRAALRDVDPGARLFTPGFVNGPDRLALFLAAGGAALVDGVAYHFYAGGTRRFLDQLAEVRGVMRMAGAASLPLWNTECGVEAAAPVTPQAQVEAGIQLARFMMLAAAGGIERFYDYAWDDGRTGMTDASGAALPRLAAWRQVRRWLLDARLQAPECGADGRVLIEGECTEGRFALAWAEPAQPWPADWPRPRRVERLFQAASAPTADLAPAPTPLRIQWSAA